MTQDALRPRAAGEGAVTLGPEAIASEAPVDLSEEAQSEPCRERCHHVCELSAKRAAVPVPGLCGLLKNPPPL